MMPKPSVFENEVALPDDDLSDREKTLIGFDLHYAFVRDHLRLLLNGGSSIAGTGITLRADFPCATWLGTRAH